MSSVIEIPDKKQILARIDAIMRELEILRHIVTEPAPIIAESEKKTKQADALFGAAGQGAWDEYIPDIDVLRFADEFIN